MGASSRVPRRPSRRGLPASRPLPGCTQLEHQGRAGQFAIGLVLVQQHRRDTRVAFEQGHVLHHRLGVARPCGQTHGACLRILFDALQHGLARRALLEHGEQLVPRGRQISCQGVELRVPATVQRRHLSGGRTGLARQGGEPGALTFEHGELLPRLPDLPPEQHGADQQQSSAESAAMDSTEKVNARKASHRDLRWSAAAARR